MPIDFNLAPDVEEIRQRVRKFMESDVRPAEDKLREEKADRKDRKSTRLNSSHT